MITQSSAILDSDPSAGDLLRAWHLERWLGFVRTLNVPLCLLLIPLAPGVPAPLAILLAVALALGVPAPLAILLAVALALGDSGVLGLLRFTPSPGKLRAVRALATVIEWIGAFGVIALCAPLPAIPVPTLLLLALGLTAGRYGLRGLLGGTVAAWLTILALAMAQAQLLGVRDAAAAGRAGLGWAVLIGVVALSLGAFLGFAAHWQARSAPAPTALPAVAADAAPTAATARPLLSRRERQVLALLARETTDGELRFKEIAHELGVSRNTIKSHGVNIARKLGAVNTSRRAILQAAWQRGELPSPGPPAGGPSGDGDDSAPPGDGGASGAGGGVPGARG